jgi:hypothetical protein
VAEVAVVVTVSEPGHNFPQVSPSDRLMAERTEGLRARCPVIDQNELHAATLNVRKRVMPGVKLAKPVGRSIYR